MKNKIFSFLSSEKKLSKAIFSILVAAVFVFVSGPNLYAQFARQDGLSGWGYGNGYGYGYGYGFDSGSIAGYRTTGSNLNQYGYGYGYGYMASGVTYDATNGYSVTDSTISSLVSAGVMTPVGSDITNTTAVNFNSEVTMTVGGLATVNIPAGTTMTAASATSFSALTAGTASVTDLTGAVGGGVQFGLSSLGLTLSQAITISIPVSTSYNGNTLIVYTKAAGGSSWSVDSSCVVVSGACTFTTDHLSSFATSASTTSSGSGSGSSGSSSGAVACTTVTYGSWGTCTNGYQYREANTAPVFCTLSAAQQAEVKRACGGTEPVDNTTTTITINPDGTVTVTGGGETWNDVIVSEKSLMKKINKLLTKRLLGRILLQVEAKGRAWYVNPVNGEKYFLGRPADAFFIMRKLSLGINNSTFASFSNGKAPARLAGRILLKVEDKGMAYYVNPVDLKMYYLGRPADAFSIMKKLGLGITNDNLRQITVNEDR